MPTILQFDLTLYGQEVSGISVPIGSTVQFNLTCQDPSTRSAVNLTTFSVIMAVNPIDARGNPFQPSIISRQATITNAASGLCYVPWASGDTVPSGIPVSPGNYSIEIWLEDNSGNRVQDMGTGYVQLSAVGRLPNALVNPLPSQVPSISGYNLIEVSGSPVTQRNILNFISGATAVDNSGNQSTDVTVGGVPSGTDGQFLGHVSGSPQYVTLTQDMISPAFAVSLAISGVANPQEAGASIVNPQFTDTHNQTPSVASLTGPDSVNHPISPATLTSLGYGGAANTFSAQTFTDPGSTLNQVFSWTYSATAGGITRTASSSITFERRCYFDMVDIGTYNASFITSLGSTRLQAGFTTNYAFAAGDGVKYAHLAIPTGWGNPSVFKEHVSQLPVSWTKVASGVSVTNVNGVVISYEIWRAPQANTAAFSYDVS